MKNRLKATIWTLILWIFIFHGVLEDLIPVFKLFDESIALLCFPLTFVTYIKGRQNEINRTAKGKRVQFLLLLGFWSSGLLGSFVYNYQPMWVVAVSAILAAKFFMILLSAGQIQRFFQINIEEQETAVQILSLVWFLYYVLCHCFRGYLVGPTDWDICAKSTLLFSLLIFCRHKNIWLYRICLLMMVSMLLLSGKEKAYSALFVFILLYYIIVHKKVQTKIRYIFYMAVPIVLIAWDKIYYYYIQGHGKYAKSLMTTASLQIAKDYFPIGTGFGTFGSTYAASQYSPVYYLYGIAKDPTLGPESKLYLQDLFWPILFGETGVIGTIFYCGIIFVLFLQIQRVYFYNKKKYMLLIFMYIFMLITTFTESGFMQPMTMGFAFIMGMLLEEYEEKRNYKLRFFEKKEWI